jgi:hypothetical protein
MEGALVDRDVAEEADHDLPGAADLRAQRGPDRHRHRTGPDAGLAQAEVGQVHRAAAAHARALALQFGHQRV